ncbi:MAG: preprotein translocase subunit SecG [Oscillospiraceae bacterium]|nr:preprotein translocase subunit SecG [Oscillospiraceae bacterium]
MTLELVLTILQVVSGLIVSIIILLQSGKSAGLSGAIAGGADTFFSKGKSKTLDQKLAKATKWIALVFVLLTLALHII